MKAARLLLFRFAKSFVAAERCSLFLLDKENGELYSSVFDSGQEEEGKTIFHENEIRYLPIYDLT